jgi:hypothetical protein
MSKESIEVVKKVYNTILNRFPDEEGLLNYASFLDKGKSIKWLELTLKSSDEFKEKKKRPVIVKKSPIVTNDDKIVETARQTSQRNREIEKQEQYSCIDQAREIQKIITAHHVRITEENKLELLKLEKVRQTEEATQLRITEENKLELLKLEKVRLTELKKVELLNLENLQLKEEKQITILKNQQNEYLRLKSETDIIKTQNSLIEQKRLEKCKSLEKEEAELRKEILLIEREKLNLEKNSLKAKQQYDQEEQKFSKKMSAEKQKLQCEKEEIEKQKLKMSRLKNEQEETKLQYSRVANEKLQKSLLVKKLEYEKEKKFLVCETNKLIAQKRHIQTLEESTNDTTIDAMTTMLSVTNRKTINIFLCVRDNENDVGTTLSALRIIERNHNDLEFCYYILENDSKDSTPHQIIDFFSHAKGRYRIEKSEKRKWGTVQGMGRVSDMAKYRNMMKELCESWDNSEYSFIIDTGVLFQSNIFDQMINLMSSSSDIVMITPFGQVGEKKQYYDTFALETSDGIRGKYPKYSPGEILDVNSAFGGFVLIKTNVLKQCSWGVIDGKCSEHNLFCKNVSKHGRIVIATNIIVKWSP